jgi:hypothetical protein
MIKKILFLLLPVLATGILFAQSKSVKIPPNKDTVLVTSITTTTVIPAQVTTNTTITTTVLPTNPGPGPGPGGELSLSFTPETGYIELPFARVEQWFDQNYAPIPAGSPGQRLDVYWRFLWTQLEGPTINSYSWVKFDQVVNAAIQKRQRVSIGVFLHCPGGCDPFNGPVFYDGFSSGYPLYLHNAMQSEPVKDRAIGTTTGNRAWVPNWNSENLLSRAEALLFAMRDHINATAFNGVAYQNVINYIDIRFMGSYGEWHHAGIVNNMSEYPTGMRPTVATYKRFINMHVAAFPKNPLVMLLATLDAERLNNTLTPVEVTNYALTISNAWGPLGIRADQQGSLQWNDPNNYVNQYMQNNNKSWAGGPLFSTYTMNRWKTSPLVGEPENNSDNPNLQTLVAQAQLYKRNSVGNGNYTRSAGADLNMQNAANAMGYKLQMTGGKITFSNTAITVAINWRNTGQTPIYETWETVIDIINSTGQVVQSKVSTFKPRLFLPAPSSATFTDNLPGLPVGSYTAVLTIKDPTGYRQPLPLYIKGRNANGSYTLGSFTIGNAITNN